MERKEGQGLIMERQVEGNRAGRKRKEGKKREGKATSGRERSRKEKRNENEKERKGKTTFVPKWREHE